MTTLVLRPDGSVVAPDLTDEAAALAVALGGDRPAARPSRLGAPRLPRAAAVGLCVPRPLAELSEAELWRWHRVGARLFRHGWRGRGACSWVAVKSELARRLLGPCRLCARRCPVDRRTGERGSCGLGPDARCAGGTRLWGEESELGVPGLAWHVVGCGLRCRFCYRPELLTAAEGGAVPDHPLTPSLARRGNPSGAPPTFPLLAGGWSASQDPPHPLGTDQAPLAPHATHLHLLGGNPDESLAGLLPILVARQDPLPVVWNTHAYLTREQTALLEGVVDAVVADLKFGPGPCGRRVAGVRGYWPAATAALRRLAGYDLRLIVRHVALPGHLACCAEPAARWARAHLPRARVRVLEQYEPWGAARDDPALARRLNAAERRHVAALGDDPPEHGLER